jgi:methionyl-tRNA synthetase
VPWDEKHVIYVWIDALQNYITAVGYGRDEDMFRRIWPADVHLIGKDILKFHAVIWPAMLMAADVELPRRLFIHGFLLMQGEKMSKTLGNVLDPFQVIDVFGVDALRYYCFREVSFGQDGSVSAAGFEARYESELANEYGNLASRTLAMINRYRDGAVPGGELDRELLPAFEGAVGRVRQELDRAELSQALEEIWRLVRRLNQFVEETRPWDLAKDDARPADLDRVLYSLAEGLRVTTLLLYPYLPQSAERLLGVLGESERGLAELGSRPGGQRIETLPPLFPKVEAAGNGAATRQTG